MSILDAEYQFDRHKLTFFFEAERRIDFRELVSELFSQYKTRIWMQQVDTSSLSLHDPGVELAQATGFLPSQHNNMNYTFVQSPTRFGSTSCFNSPVGGNSYPGDIRNSDGQLLLSNSISSSFSSTTISPNSQRTTSYSNGTGHGRTNAPFSSPPSVMAPGSSTLGTKSGTLPLTFPEMNKSSRAGSFSPVCVTSPANEEGSLNTVVPLFESSSLWNYGF